MFLFFKKINSKKRKWYRTIAYIALIGILFLFAIYSQIDNSRLSLLLKDSTFVETSILRTQRPHINAVRLMNYLRDINGKKILSGQQLGKDSLELEVIYKVTGKSPAIIGLDLMDYSPSRVEHGAYCEDIEKAIEWWHDGGIVTFCWHWNAPMGLIDEAPDQYWWSGMYTRATTFDFSKGLEDHKTEEYRLLIRDIDAIALELKKLQDEGVPILLRPLHEASGEWFWWSNKGPEAYKKLWRLMFQRLTEYHQIKNLIWVWNGMDPDWYPGDDVVDIVGEHAYLEQHDYSPLEKEFKRAHSYGTEYKMVALTENGPMPNPDILVERDIMWLWFCTWCEPFIVDKARKIYSEEYTEIVMLKKVYDHEYVITRDELPDIQNYSI